MRAFYLELRRKNGKKYPLLFSSRAEIEEAIGNIKFHKEREAGGDTTFWIDTFFDAYTFKIPFTTKGEKVDAIQSFVKNAMEEQVFLWFKSDRKYEPERLFTEEILPQEGAKHFKRIPREFFQD